MEERSKNGRNAAMARRSITNVMMRNLDIMRLPMRPSVAVSPMLHMPMRTETKIIGPATADSSPMNAESFVENPGSGADDYTVTTATLYFANESGDKLVRETVNISYSSNVSLEKLVVEQLISGPLTQDAYPTIPKETKLLNISVKDGICYVNLDNGFLSQGYDVTEAVPIYSIVNSLTDIPGISRVQILINGETNLVFRESIRFDTIFSRNLDIIEEE